MAFLLSPIDGQKLLSPIDGALLTDQSGIDVLTKNVAIGAWNAVTYGALAAGSAWSGLPVTNLKIPRASPAESWRTAAGVTSSFLKIDALVEVQWQAWTLHRTNLTDNAVITIGVWNDGGTATGIPATGADIPAGYGQTTFTTLTPISGRYCYIQIDDPTNPDGYLQVGLVYAGPLWQPTVNIARSTTLGRDIGADEVQTRGGQRYLNPRWSARRWDLVHSYSSDADLWNQFLEIDAIARTGENILVLPAPFDNQVDRQAVFGPWKMTTDITDPLGIAAAHNFTVRITEAL